MAQLPLIRQNQAANCPHRWRNSQIITIGILLGLFWAMFDNLGSLWWAKLGGSLVRSILSSKEPFIFGPP